MTPTRTTSAGAATCECESTRWDAFVEGETKLSIISSSKFSTEGPQHARGVAGDDAVGGDVTGDDRAGADDGALTYRDVCENCGARPDRRAALDQRALDLPIALGLQ